jgi:hypothetical protein
MKSIHRAKLATLTRLQSNLRQLREIANRFLSVPREKIAGALKSNDDRTVSECLMNLKKLFNDDSTKTIDYLRAHRFLKPRRQNLFVFRSDIGIKEMQLVIRYIDRELPPSAFWSRNDQMDPIEAIIHAFDQLGPVVGYVCGFEEQFAEAMDAIKSCRKFLELEESNPHAAAVHKQFFQIGQRDRPQLVKWKGSYFFRDKKLEILGKPRKIFEDAFKAEGRFIRYSLASDNRERQEFRRLKTAILRSGGPADLILRKKKFRSRTGEYRINPAYLKPVSPLAKSSPKISRPS